LDTESAGPSGSPQKKKTIQFARDEKLSGFHVTNTLTFQRKLKLLGFF
jgi:hypothetical protein